MSMGEMRILTGQRVVLIGRQSFAGIVIDEIRLPED
jgi:hypothetical protein